ncbi:Mediator complex subunit Med14 [Penicillium waksmanii]|uniref:Mediator complex subunit Med14 n=1 Tax=Penicillium waksmanii TaxID=69791 RepID=UPI0025492B5F|nr:Mediator complex subunit Med14 [Penicillium waksmanii]KAJ5988237.1 Mediator complex subunit Med14 [Penicillium waksmanii]
MPGVIMDNVNTEGSVQRPAPNETVNGVSGSYGNHEKSGQHPAATNGPVLVNGAGRGLDALSQQSKMPIRNAGDIDSTPFDLPHITQGFFPFGTLINRAVQQCWNDLSELITELAAIQSSENVHKKLRILDFAYAKRAEFIKLLVLSQWSRQAAEVSRLIDIQNFIRTRHQSYISAVQYVGEMKRDLVRAQVANPDLKTALEILSKGRVGSLPDFGYKPPKPLTAKSTLKKLRKINRIISVRLAVYDEVPHALRNYRIHDGRVTFTVPGEFELDLAVAEQTNTSQFFFVDIRFLFSPSSKIPKGRIFNELDAKVNEILHNDGLSGCFDFLHGLVLTNKLSTLHRQAVDLARGAWSDSLRIELLHRILVIQYWSSRAGPKSWIEIGVQRGSRKGANGNKNQVPYLGLRWVRDGQRVNSDIISFDSTVLSLEQVLRSVIALHTSHLLATAFNTLKKSLLFASHTLSLRAQLSKTEPSDCHLDMQLTASRDLRISAEPLSGAITLSGPSSALERPDLERQHKSAIDEMLSRVTRLRCHTAVNQIELGIKPLGLESINQRGIGVNVSRLFPPNTLRSAFFSHQSWDRRWVVAATSSMDGDKWWLVHILVRPTDPTRPLPLSHFTKDSAQAHAISNNLMPSQKFDYSTCSELVHCLSGILAIYANARCLADLPGALFHPPLKQLRLGPKLEVPDLVFSYKANAIPAVFRLALPPALQKGSYLRDSVRLSFKGIDRQTHSAILVAYGSFRFCIRSLLPLISSADQSLVVQDNGSGFAIRLLVPVGQAVLIPLLERLQRLDCVIYILQSLLQRKMEPRSLSLSQIAFKYGETQTHSARLSIDVSEPPPSSYTEVKAALSNLNPLFRLGLRIDFDSPSPHRRIQESLTVALNDRFSKSGVESTLGSIAETFPLLHSLEQITKPVQPTSCVIHVIVRSPTVFLIHYTQKARFLLSAQPRQGRTVWLLEDFKTGVGRGQGQGQGQSQISTSVREQVYNSKGDGWQGLGDGALSSTEKVGNLLAKLHECLSSCAPEPIPEPTKQENVQQSGTVTQSQQPPAPAPVQAPVTSAPKQRTKPNFNLNLNLMAQPQLQAQAPPQQQQQNSGAPGNADIITID